MGTWTAIYVHSFVSTTASVPYIVMLAAQLSKSELARLVAALAELQ